MEEVWSGALPSRSAALRPWLVRLTIMTRLSRLDGRRLMWPLASSFFNSSAMAWRLMPNIAAKSFWLVWSDSLSVAKTRPWPRRGSKACSPRGDLAPGETSRLCDRAIRHDAANADETAENIVLDIAVGGVVACAVLRRLTRGHYVVDRVVSGYGGVVAGAAHVRNPYVSAACCRRWIRRDSASSSSAASPARSAGSRSARSRRPRWFRPWTRRSNRRWRAAGWRGDAA